MTEEITLDPRARGIPLRGGGFALIGPGRTEPRCEYSWLFPSQCAHCRGDELPEGIVPETVSGDRRQIEIETGRIGGRAWFEALDAFQRTETPLEELTEGAAHE